MSSAERLKVIERHLSSSFQNSDASSYLQSLQIAEENNFKYTLNNPRLNLKQRKFYEENGYILIPDLIDEKIINECCDHFIDLCEHRANFGAMTMMKDIALKKTGATGQNLYYKVQDILFDDVFIKYLGNNKLLDVVECFTGPNIKGIHSMLINKPPDAGALTSRHPLHQDLHYFPFRPADRIVAAWTALEDVTEDNGCLFVLPGTHKGKLEQHDYPQWEGGVNKAFHGVIGFDDYPKVFLPMKKGETVLFHPLLIHGSGTNRTKGYRKAISCHYAASECYYIDVVGTTQEGIANEIKEIAATRGLVGVTEKDIMQYRARLLRGIEVTL